MAEEPESMSTTTHGASQAVDVSTANERPCLTILHHPDPALQGLRAFIEADAKVELGRRSLAFGGHALDASKVSREHAVIEHVGHELVIRDLGSRNGTFVQGKPIHGPTALEPGDVVGMGAIIILFHRSALVAPNDDEGEVVGPSYALARVRAQAKRVAPTSITVLIGGETGTGKERVARLLHRFSGRSGGFYAINCGAMTETVLQSELFGASRGAFSGADRDRPGLFEAADRGTLFLDEIGDAPPTLQQSLLRVLQEREIRRVGATRSLRVDTRVVAATHKNLAAMVADGSFREDLYARLSSWTITTPALRERREDILPLARHFLRERGDERSIHPRLALLLVCYAFPHNVRELEHIIERARIEASGDVIRVSPELEAQLTRPAGPPPSAPPASSRKTGRARRTRPPREELEALLARFDGNVTHIAEHLNIGRNTFYRWLRDLGVDRHAHEKSPSPDD